MAFIGTFRTELKAALGATVTNGALTLSAANVIVGYDDRDATAEIVAGVGTSNALLYIKPGKVTGIDSQTRLREWTVPCELYFGITRETDNQMTDGEGLLEKIFDRWDNAANFTGRGIPEDITTDEPEVDVKQSPAFVHYHIELKTTACG